ncbi:MAG TPA: hypothetical protein DCG12_15580 [Planctomycetaceae bacterium]|nr:hypothetical protein [Planctomycetaceae bacterium]
MSRTSWVDPDNNEPLIGEHAQKLESFVKAFEDGQITTEELSNQESDLVKLLKKVEESLNDEQHALVTELLCELTAYDIMHFTHEFQKARIAEFRG